MKKDKNIFKPLDRYEERLIKAIENDELVEVSNQKEEVNKYTAYFKQAFKKNKRITIRVSHNDLKDIQEKAVRTGIPYQTLISAILHKFAKGRLNIGI